MRFSERGFAPSLSFDVRRQEVLQNLPCIFRAYFITT